MIEIICPRCSHINPTGSIACGRCGSPLTVHNPGAGDYVPPRRNPKQGSKALIAIIAVLGVVLLLVLAVLLFLLLKVSPASSVPFADVPSSTQNYSVSESGINTAVISGKIVARFDLSGNNDESTVSGTDVIIPSPISSPVSMPYSNPVNSRQRYMNNAAKAGNYEYYNIYNASNQTDRNLHARVAFEKWDVLLNEVYNYLKNTMSPSEFKALDKDELNWINRKETAISQAVSYYKGTAKETEARYMTGTYYTRERCYYLISLINESASSPKPQQESIPAVRDNYLNRASQIESYESNIKNAGNQTDRNLHARVAFEKWDVLLNDIYSYLRNNMSKSEFKALDADELSWIKRKETAISNAAAEHKGLATETEARYTTGISYTKERCYYLISLIEQ